MARPICLFATSISHCRFCDAVVEDNKFEHDPNCLINVQGRHEALKPFWRGGRLGYQLSPQTSATPEQIKAHEMGKAIRGKLERPKQMIGFPAPFIALESFTD